MNEAKLKKSFGVALALFWAMGVTGATAQEQEAHVSVIARWHLSYHAPRVLSAERLPAGLLLVCPGLNGEGAEACREDGPWAKFADRYNLWILSPTFHCDSKDVRDRRKCYYYPESGSFEWLLTEIDKLADQHGISDRKLLLFGFSAGAHVVHRLALWRPERVKAVAAYSAGWWDIPKKDAQSVSMLIMCGEQDERYEPSIAFYREAMKVGWPVAWRSFSDVGHTIDDRVLTMTQCFLAAFVETHGLNPWIGDIQEWLAYPADSKEAQAIPLEYRAILPSEQVAKVWETIDP